MIQCVSGMCKAMGSNPSTAKQTNKHGGIITTTTIISLNAYLLICSQQVNIYKVFRTISGISYMLSAGYC